LGKKGGNAAAGGLVSLQKKKTQNPPTPDSTFNPIQKINCQNEVKK
jgi:hypothetical protein